MAVLETLLKQLPDVKETRMSAEGIAFWICWQDELDPLVPQTLQDYGGMCMATDLGQALWFFFSNDALLALARLTVWARFNTFPAFLQVFPATLVLGVKREATLRLAPHLFEQEMNPTKDFTAWVSPSTLDSAFTIPGMSFEPRVPLEGMAATQWLGATADSRLPYTSSQGWYVLLHPLGNPLDKKFQAGWRSMFEEVEKIIQRRKLKFNVYEYFVTLPVDTLRTLRAFMKDYLAVFAQLKAEQAEKYWPCVSALVERKGLNFNNELPKKVNIQWDHLMPDYPFMSYRNAYLLGEGFAIFDIRYSGAQASMDSMCNVSLDEGISAKSAIPVLIADQLLSGGSNCFYCGVRSHTPVNCPSLQLRNMDFDTWDDIVRLDLDSVNQGFRTIENTLMSEGNAGYAIIQSSNGPEARLLRAVLSINMVTQLRVAPSIWLARTKDYPRCLENRHLVRDDSPAWDIYDQLLAATETNLSSVEKELINAMNRNPRDSRLRTLYGFLALERNDLTRALGFWKEAESMSATPIQQAWHTILIGRLYEVQGRYPDAIEQYSMALRIIPQWYDLEYRRIVCSVKMGFAEQSLADMHQVIVTTPQLFNRFILDPELERGHLLILTSLYQQWSDAQKQGQEELTALRALQAEVETWFPEDHHFSLQAHEQLNELIHLAESHNYVAILQVSRLRPLLEKETKDRIQQEIELLQEQFQDYLAVLQRVRDEASWFPFPAILMEFNKKFNECAGMINWAFGADFRESFTFLRAKQNTEAISEILVYLQGRLKFLRMVRDATLFVLILVRTFLWVEIIGLVLCMLGIPAIAYFGDRFGMGWVQGMVRQQQWELQKILLAVVTIVAVGAAALRTTLVFEKKRDRLLSDARSQREEIQQQRLQRIREQKIAQQTGGKKPKVGTN